MVEYSKRSVELALENKDAISRIEVSLQNLANSISQADEDSDDIETTKIYTKQKKKQWFLVS